MTYIYLLKNKWEEVFLTLLEDTIKQIINTWNVMTIKVQVNVFFIWIQTIYIVGQWVDIFPMADLNGWIKNKLINLMKIQLVKIFLVTYYNLTLNTLINCIIYIVGQWVNIFPMADLNG